VFSGQLHSLPVENFVTPASAAWADRQLSGATRQICPTRVPNERLLKHVPRVDRQCGASDVSARVAAEVDHRIADVDGFDERNGH
jgi:hypothetical protein